MKPKRRKSRYRRIGIAAICVLTALVAAIFAVPACIVGEPEAPIEVTTLPAPATGGQGIVSGESATLKVMTLNVAHGRKDGPHQALQKRTTIQSNSNDIAEVLRRESPDVVALQEADGPSVWSGKFNHVQYLAQKAEFRYSVRGEHVKGLQLHYGTALLSRLPLKDAVSITFAPSPPTFPKGFVVCAVGWPGDPGTEIDVVSAHLDYSRRSVRHKQIQGLIGKLQPRERPLIIMGDFNCEWTAGEQTLSTLADELDLRAYRPEAVDLNTFPSSHRRLDWILISRELEFLTYEVLPDTISDHLALIARLRMGG